MTPPVEADPRRPSPLGPAPRSERFVPPGPWRTAAARRAALWRSRAAGTRGRSTPSWASPWREKRTSGAILATPLPLPPPRAATSPGSPRSDGAALPGSARPRAFLVLPDCPLGGSTAPPRPAPPVRRGAAPRPSPRAALGQLRSRPCGTVAVRPQRCRREAVTAQSCERMAAPGREAAPHLRRAAQAAPGSGLRSRSVCGPLGSARRSVRVWRSAAGRWRCLPRACSIKSAAAARPYL